MTKNEKKFIKLSFVMAAVFGVTQNTYAMHIMEGYLPLKYCLFYGAICLPFLAIGVVNIKKIVNEHRKTLLLLAMMGAYAFVLSALKIPSVTGSSSHPTGTGLGAIIFGPCVMSVLGIIVLLFQAILLAHGGLTTLGANTFSMAIAGPFVSYGIFVAAKKLKLNRYVGVFLATSIGDLFTYCVTSVQLGVAHPNPIGGAMASIKQFMTVFAVTQIPLAIIEGLLAVVVIIGLEAYASRELKDTIYVKRGAIIEE
ncbi:MAG: energy-coupling factor ABC transporter permease [Lachnospiraceae bacterium]|nr:energy-coupling factor ABC transporter permease [Lachnospiraceae bacterium]